MARRKLEKNEDFMTMDSKPRCETDLEIEQQAATRYTRKMYNIFHVEFSASASYWKEKVSKSDNITEYNVGKSTKPKSTWKKVIYEVSSLSFTCSCAKFEIEGILCRHILCIMRFKIVRTIPEKYILRRWTIDARYHQSRTNLLIETCDGSNINHVTPFVMFSLRVSMSKLLDEASSSLHLYKEIDKWMNDKLTEIMSKQKHLAGEAVVDKLIIQKGSTQGFEDITKVFVLDPNQPVKTKGRPRKISRFQEKESIKRQRTCKHCQDKGHYKRACPKLKDSLNGSS